MPLREVSMPSGFITALASARSQAAVLATTTQWIPRIIESERSSIALPDGPGRLKIMALVEETTILPTGAVFDQASSLVGLASSTGEVQTIPDIADSSFSDTRILYRAGLRSAIVGPMMSGGRCLGTINLGNTTPGFFNPNHVLTLKCIADLVGSFLNVLQLAEEDRRMATYDALTSALTRRASLQALDDLLADSHSSFPAVIYLDLDNFKAVNDSHGHSTGDDVLRIVALRIESLLGEGDRLGRLGGDEFIVIVKDDPAGERARDIATEIDESVATVVTVRSLCIEPRISIGIAHSGTGAQRALELLGDADHAMYKSKSTGTVVVADEGTRIQTAQITAIDRDVNDAMSHNAMRFHYQPLRELASGQIIGAEALIRWNHPLLGPLPAPLIINRIQATGSIHRFTRWCLETIAADLGTIRSQAAGFANSTISINLTPRQLSWEQYSDLHVATCEIHGFEPRDLVIEVVESSEIRPGDPAQTTLRELSAAGCQIALDDFGTGHNALGYFTQFPIHAVKFDRSLVGIMSSNEAAGKILKALAAMADDLGVQALAEGVESEVEARLCRAVGIQFGQGWHLGRPAPIDDFIALVEQSNVVIAS